ncbi:topoisomerase [Streptomyces sp. NPDC006602]|uniref:topoisomerase n=1 Tax=Streptomyces sp. NPDC006602 TaxID=3364751 RepID=UPI0036838B47
MKPKNTHVQNSVEIAKRYHQSYQGSPAEEYVAARGLAKVASSFGLGYVDSAIPGHERYAGYLALPYIRPAGGEDGVATVRFRCIADACVKDSDGTYFFLKGEKERHQEHGKYRSLPGDPPRLYNTSALIEPSPVLVVVEGEFDTQSWALAGIPSVGAPGTGTWRDYWTPALLGYETVFLIAEDEPGLVFMDELAADLPNGKVVKMTDSRDSNSVLLNFGPEALAKRIGM